MAFNDLRLVKQPDGTIHALNDLGETILRDVKIEPLCPEHGDDKPVNPFGEPSSTLFVKGSNTREANFRDDFVKPGFKVVDIDATHMTFDEAKKAVEEARAVGDETITQEAERITGSSRNLDYGHPLDNHSKTAALWNAYLTGPTGVMLAIDARSVCMMNILQKVSRDSYRPKRDNLVDIAGYARNAEMIDDEIERRRKETST